MALLIAIILGIWPGIALAQTANWVFFGGILGWFAFPLVLMNVIEGVNYATLPPLVLAACGYPLAMLGYSIYAYQAMQHIQKGKVMLLLLAMAGVSALVSIPTDAITRNIIHSQDVLTSSSAGLVSTYILVLVELIISVVLGWVIALAWQRREKHHNQPLEIIPEI